MQSKHNNKHGGMIPKQINDMTGKVVFIIVWFLFACDQFYVEIYLTSGGLIEKSFYLFTNMFKFILFMGADNNPMYALVMGW